MILKKSLISLSLIVAPLVSISCYDKNVSSVSSLNQVDSGLSYSLPAGSGLIFSDNYMKSRERFFQKFFFEGHVAEKRIEKEKLISFADQTIDMGRALMFLASESYVLSQNGYDTSGTESAINTILNKFKEIESSPYEEQIYGVSQQGFFLRDAIERSNRQGVPEDYRIESDLDSTLHNNAYIGHPAMSNDQVIHLLVGWWAVSRWSSSSENINLSSELTELVMDYLQSQGYFIVLPNGDPVKSHRGPSMRLSSLQVSKIADKITNRTYYEDGSVTFDIGFEHEISLPTLRRLLPEYDSVFYSLLSESEIRVDFGVLGEFKYETKSYSRNLVFLAMALENQLDTDIFMKTSFKNGHYLSTLLRSIAAEVKPSNFLNESEIAKMVELHSQYPEEGSVNLPENGRWGTSYAWSRDVKNDGDGSKRFNGLDFLAYENFMHISQVFSKDIGVSRDQIKEFVTSELGLDFNDKILNEVTNRLKVTDWNDLKIALLRERVIEIYRSVYGMSYTPSESMIVEGLTYSGKFSSLLEVVNSRFLASIVVITNSILLH